MSGGYILIEFNFVTFKAKLSKYDIQNAQKAILWSFYGKVAESTPD